MIRLNGTAMNVSWVPLNLVEARGIVQSYIITYQQASSGSQRKRQIQMVQVDGNFSYAIVGGLQSGVAYEVTVSGMTTQTGPGEHEWSMELEIALVSHKILLTHLRAFVLSHVSTLPNQLFSSFPQHHPQHKCHQNPYLHLVE